MSFKIRGMKYCLQAFFPSCATIECLFNRGMMKFSSFVQQVKSSPINSLNTLAYSNLSYFLYGYSCDSKRFSFAFSRYRTECSFAAKARLIKL